MPAQSKIDMLEKVNAALDASDGVYVIDYQGLSVKESQELRRNLTQSGATMKVFKNNIVRIALEQKGMPEIDDVLVGTCAYVFYEKDAAAAAKAIKEEADKLKKLEFKGGIVDGTAITADQAKAYADLPSHDQVMAQLAGLISGFARDIAVCVKEVPAGLARAIKAINEEQEAA